MGAKYGGLNISYPVFCGDLVYKFKNFTENPNASDLSKRIVDNLKNGEN